MNTFDSFQRREFMLAAAGGCAATIANAADGVLSTRLNPIELPHELAAGKTIEPKGRRTSPNGRFALYLRDNGDLVWLDRGHILWHTGTEDTTSAECHMQADGNLVLYGVRGVNGGHQWSSRTAKNDGAKLVCQDDGNLVMYAGPRAIWQTHTAVSPIAAVSPLVKASEKWVPTTSTTS